MQRVDAHQENVIVEVDEFYHLLHATVYLGAYESAETAHAVVDMDHIVADLYLTKLLERQCKFSRAGAVALQIVLVESVKYLMVGEYTCLGHVVDKSFMDCRDDGGELYVVAPVLKYGAQSFYLLFGVAENVDGVTVADELQQ